MDVVFHCQCTCDWGNKITKIFHIITIDCPMYLFYLFFGRKLAHIMLIYVPLCVGLFLCEIFGHSLAPTMKNIWDEYR